MRAYERRRNRVSGRGTVDRVVASHTGGPGFESSHCTLLCNNFQPRLEFEYISQTDIRSVEMEQIIIRLETNLSEILK